MAEEGAATLPELAGFDEHLEVLSVKYSRRGLRIDSQSFCSEFCQLVEDFCGVQGSPAPQLRVLEVALCYFFTASSFLPPHCDHVHCTLSSLALSVFELLLFFDQKEFSQDTLQHLTYTFQECHLALAKHPNVYLLQLKSLIQDGGPWGNQVLLAILSDSDVPQSKVDRFISSEAPVFLQLRVRYLLSSGRTREAATLARHCSARLSSRQRPFFLQVHLAWLCKTEQTEQLHREAGWCCCGEVLHPQAAEPQACEAVGGMSRSLLQVGHFTITGRSSPFIRVLPEAVELGNMGLQFCVELCSQALQSGLVSDSSTKSLVYKTVASLLPRDLEVCRACALLVFCQERTLEAYRTVVHLYSLPDQEYHAETTPIGNHVRFDLLQVLKKGLVFDPEFWNITAIRSHCLKLLNGKVLKAAREEVPEEESHCTKEAAVCPNTHQPLPPTATDPHRSEFKKCHKNGMAPKRTRLCRGNEQTAADSTLQKKMKRTQRTPSLRESGDFLRRSFWQPSKTNDRFSLSPSHGEQRRITRFSETNRPKRRVRTPRWLLEDSGTLEENAHRKVKKLRNKRQQEEEEAQEKARPLVKRNTSTLPKTSSKEMPLVKCDLAENQSVTRHLKGLSLDYLRPTSPAQVILEFSLPDNELSDIFTDESFSRRNGLPPVVLYKTSVKEPHPSRSDKTVHLKRVIIRAPDEVSLAQQLHCYARRNKHLTVASRIRSTPSVVTRSSAQAPPTKGRHGRSCSKPLVEMKVTIASQTPGTILNSSPSKTVAPSSPPRTEKSASSLSKPDSEEEMDQETEDSGDQTSVPPESEESHLEYRCTLCNKEADSAVETCCPVVGCHWHGNLSRSPLTLLYHALEDHHRDDTPLELAFHMGNGQCSVCLRVLWSFQHYQHHVERHRLTPRHPCLHQGCGARFKTGMEMRRHSRKHIPLQASCCVPGCSELFICLWALNLHEREHYAVKNDKSAKACGEENRGHSKTEQTRRVSGPRTVCAYCGLYSPRTVCAYCGLYSPRTVCAYCGLYSPRTVCAYCGLYSPRTVCVYCGLYSPRTVCVYCGLYSPRTVISHHSLSSPRTICTYCGLYSPRTVCAHYGFYSPRTV
ncbi:hypothetical protein CRUP_018938 [Coryphaenoides rupestris]|nr:hypothetical protein CRUP_018938 [Coryphaenoides rupestris]